MSSEFSMKGKFCGDCEYLNFTEKEQKVQEEITGREPEHYCYRYEVELGHIDERGMDLSPKIVKCDICGKVT